jgi:hypothetical protein
VTSIIGAGLSGLIAATQFPQAQVYEVNGPECIAHKAVLRFRSDVLSRLIGIPFRKVMVRKSIYSNGAHHSANIDLANNYSRKTNGGYLDRSIWKLDPSERFIAPENLQQQLVAFAGNRIHWETAVTPEELRDEHRSEPIISTMPMPVLMKMLDWPLLTTNFSFKRIVVDRFRVNGADLFQTIYYPDASTSMYRASITGDLLIMERIEGNAEVPQTEPDYDMVLRSFGLRASDCTPIELGHAQRFGKIAPILDSWRRRAIYTATVKHGIYSLGRFATWRNILLDDVVDDIAIIKRMISQGHYGAAIQHSSKVTEEDAT